MKNRNWASIKIIGIACVFGILFWVVDSMYHFFGFSEHLRRMIVEKPNNILEPMIINIPPHQLFVRLVFLVFCLIVGVVVALFIARQKKVEQELKESEEHYRILTERANDAIGVIYKGKIVYANPQLSQVLGYSIDEVIGTPFTKYLKKSEISRVVDHYNRRMNNEDVESVYEVTFLHKNGAELFIEVNAGLVKWGEGAADLIIGRDITFRKIAEKALSESEEKYRTLTNNINTALYRNSIQLVGSFIEVNPAFVNMFGYTKREEIIHKKSLDFYADPDEKEQFNNELFQNGSIKNKELILKKKDGSHFVGKVSAMLIRDQEGNPKFYDGMIEDITEQKEYEKRLKETNEELLNLKQNLEGEVENAIKELREKDHLLIQQSRHASMGEMIGNIAHQWRQPLTAISVLVQDIEEANKYGELTDEYLRNSVTKTMEQVQYMSRTIDDFRNFFRPNKTKEEFSINHLINETIKFVRSSFMNNQIYLELNLETECRIKGFPNEYMQVVLNILNNAKDAMKRNPPEKPLVKISIEKIKNDECSSCLIIENNGGNIPENIIDKIFDPYYTTKDPIFGTGLGLYMAKNIIEKNMEGKIMVENIKDGVQFKVFV